MFNVNPMGKPRMTQSDKWKKRDCVVRNYALKDELIKQAKEQNYVLGHTLEIEFYIQMPEKLV